MHEPPGHPSRWIMRSLEWDDTRARYPNLWADGMPRHVLAYDRIASRLRLNDLIGVFYPQSTRHAERSNRYLGLSRVVGLRRGDEPGFAWIDLETAHRFAEPLDLAPPKRVFQCCDPGWPEAEVGQFEALLAVAREQGWREEVEPKAKPSPEPESEPSPQPRPAATPKPDAEPQTEQPIRSEPAPVPRPPAAPAAEQARRFAGAEFSGDMRDPRQGTWVAVVALDDERLVLERLDATGRIGLQRYLREGVPVAEAIGLAFPFGMPQAFSETLLGGDFPDDGWWGLVRRMGELSRPEFLVALETFREQHGEGKRLADEHSGTDSPLFRGGRDLGPRAFHGLRMIAEDRSRFAVRPFETASGRLLLEVSAEAALQRLEAAAEAGTRGVEGILDRLDAAAPLPVYIDERFRRTCRGARAAAMAVVAARSAARAVMTGEADRRADELSPDDPGKVLREGWVYGLE